MKLLKLFTMVALVIFAANSILLAQKRRTTDPKKETTPVPTKETSNKTNYQPTTVTTMNPPTNATVATVNTPQNTEKTDSTVPDDRGARSKNDKSQSSAMTAEIVQNNSTESVNAANVNTRPAQPPWQCKDATFNTGNRTKVGVAIGSSSDATDDELQIFKNELAKEFCGESFELVRLTNTVSSSYIIEAKHSNVDYIIVLDFEPLHQSSGSWKDKFVSVIAENGGQIIKEAGDIKGMPNIVDKQMGEVVTTGGIASSQIFSSFGKGQKIKIYYNLLKVATNETLLKDRFVDEEKVQGESAGEYAVRNLMRRTTENIQNKIMDPTYKLKKGK